MPRRVPIKAMVSPELRAWIEAHVALGEYEDAEACIEDAFQRLRELGEDQPLQAAIESAYQSGQSRPISDSYWESMRSDARRFAEAYHRSLQRRKSA